MLPRSRSIPRRTDPASATTNNDEYAAIARDWVRAERERKCEEAAKSNGNEASTAGHNRHLQPGQRRQDLNQLRQRAYERRWRWTVAFWLCLLLMHAVGIWLFTSGFLLTRLVLEDTSECTSPPAVSTSAPLSVERGCWHPKTFDRAVVIIIDALRYDFTIPTDLKSSRAYHNAFPFLHQTALASPERAFLRPFIADPPTTTLQRLKGLTTGTLPTFIDAGSNFAGTVIDEDSLLLQLRNAGKKVAQIGDDTWWSLFPGYFEPNISKAYDSFNVWDLHTVDNGVINGVPPLLRQDRRSEWDVLIGHSLGVDHAGHRYGPDHPAMNAKLRQMDAFIRNVSSMIDDDTLLIVMGDHGMDNKGDHGGESDDEVEAALWMYSKKPVFGHTSDEFKTPPATAKIRPVNQIDFVPTLALLLGIPIPFNNLGRPIEEAFAGRHGSDWANLAAVSRLASAGIDRYQKAYFRARGTVTGNGTLPDPNSPKWSSSDRGVFPDKQAYADYNAYQEEILGICKGLWARFDVPRMMAGVLVVAAGVTLLLMYSSRSPGDELVLQDDTELDLAEKKLELLDLEGKAEIHADQFLHANMLHALRDARSYITASVLLALALYRQQKVDGIVALLTLLLVTSMAVSLHGIGKTILNVLPRTFWGWLAVVFTLSQSVGFASNSFTIWEDSIIQFFLATFGVAMAVISFRIHMGRERATAMSQSIVFLILGRLASYSKLCREEQMPYCTSTYYASVTSSTSAPWQLIIPFFAALALPSVVRSFLMSTRSYEGLAPLWNGYIFRGGILMSATYWVIDAADNGDWLSGKLADGTLKVWGVYLAQMSLVLALVAGTTAFIWAPPCVSISSAKSRTGQPLVTILGYANVFGARYLMLPLNILCACLILSKPMGVGALALMHWQVLCLADMLDLNGLKPEPIGPVILAMLGNFYYFKTGHQAVLSSIQWDSAFIALFSVRYPWSPLAVTLNTFAGQIVAATCLPLLALWKTGPKQKGVLETVGRNEAAFLAYFAVETLATMSWAGWLRRHLMLYRVFSPRFLLAAVLLLVLDLITIAVTLPGLRVTTLSVGEVFGWAE